MPHRPLSAIRVRLRNTASHRFGEYDEPPASMDVPPHARRSRLHRPVYGSREPTNDVFYDRVTLPVPTSEARRRVYVAPSTRRRRRSESAHVDDTTDPAASDSQAPRHKRQRLDTSSPPRHRPGIKYGREGQVVPGKLKMDLISCDGGEHQDPRHPAMSLAADNILVHDKSVYSSERPFANILLRHADDAPFALEKVHIIGPEHGFTAPVRDGEIHIAMTITDLNDYMNPPPHAWREGLHNPPPYHHYRRADERDNDPSSPSAVFTPFSDFTIFPNNLAQPRTDAEAEALREQSQMVSLLGAQRSQRRRLTGTDPAASFSEEEEEPHCETPSTPPDSFSSNRHVTLLTDEDIGPEASSPQEVLDYRLHRLRQARRRFEEDRDGYADDYSRLSGPMRRLPPDLRERAEREGLNTLMARSRVRDSPTDEAERDWNTEWVPTWARSAARPAEGNGEAGKRATREGLSAGRREKDENVTSARFHIRQDKSSVAIHFDPPVSGRFLLIKLCGAAGKGNVDVQSVLALGYGACRFFPAVCPR